MAGVSLVLLHASLLVSVMPLEKAKEKLLDEGRPMLVLIRADWCPHCRTFETVTLPELKRRGSLSRLSFTMIDTDRKPELAGNLMTGRSIPQLILFQNDIKGKRRKTLLGAGSVAKVEAFLDRYLAPTLEGDSLIGSP